MSIIVRLLKDGDQALLGRAAPRVLDHRIDPVLADRFLRDPRHHLVAAIADDRPVGFVSSTAGRLYQAEATWPGSRSGNPRRVAPQVPAGGNAVHARGAVSSRVRSATKTRAISWGLGWVRSAM